MMLFRRTVLLLISLLASLPAFAATAPEVYPLTKLIIADTEARVLAIPAEAGGAVTAHVEGVPLFAGPEFQGIVAKYIGKPIGNEVLNALIGEINKYAQKHDRLIAKVLIPSQDVRAGTLRFIVLLGRYSDVQFQGNRWFSSKLLEERLGIKAGDEIRLSTLEEAVNWTNANPFRQVKVLVNELPNEPGKANLVIGVRERRPFRAALSYDDTGNSVIGDHRFTGSFQFGNLWGRDHMASYQYMTTDDPSAFRAHAADYRLPLRWRHFLQFSASYVRSNPIFAEGLLRQSGKNLSTNLRYTVPLRAGEEPREVFFGASYKHGNNNLEFDPLLTRQQVFATSTDTFQLFAGFSTVNRDKHGAWVFASTLNASPGNINSRNTDEAHQAFGSRIGASSSYLYGTLSLQRLQNLGKDGWQVFSRAVVQAATSNIISGEHLAIGGSATVRGYDENIYAAEQGYIFVTDLLSPTWKLPVPFMKKGTPPLETRLLAFYDLAEVEYKHRDPSDIPFAPLASTGVGLRLTFATNFTLSVDYGWQLKDIPQATRGKSRGHVKAVLAF